MTDTFRNIKPENLPVYREKKRILKALDENQVVVIESPTGSGKTTQLPLILHEAGYSGSGIIGVTQPRRIATLSVCDYISRQLNEEIGGFIGYKMRFEDNTALSTKIKIMTDGILLQELKADPFLSRYSVIMVDEAHERSLNIDFILGLLKKVLEQRPDLKVIISSATINARVFSDYYGECPIVHIETETFPIETRYEPPSTKGDRFDMLLEKITGIIGRLVGNGSDGDVLVFLPGEREIKECITRLYSAGFGRKLFIVPLYGRLTKEEQERVFIPTPSGKTKVVVSTNIAETSVTIDGITTVIDSGLAKINFYSPRTYTSSLIESSISKASCNQRKGRAGRTRPGRCFRLYSREDFEDRPMFTTEEIYRTDLSEVVLRMAELGISDFDTFDFISSPGKEGLVSAVETLRIFGALTDENTLSTIGKLMAVFPMLPRLSRMIVEAVQRYPDVLEETITAAAFLSAHSPYSLPQGEELEARNAHHRFSDPDGDFVSYLKLYNAFMSAEDRTAFCRKNYLDEQTMSEINNIKEQIEEIVREQGIPVSGGGKISDYLCAVSSGLLQFVCVRTGRGTYRSMTAEQISIHPGSVMFRENPRYIVAGEVVRTSRTFARSVSPLKKEWLRTISEDLYYELVAETGSKAAGKKTDNTAVKGSAEDLRNVSMAGRVFTLSPWKGNKQIADLPWIEFRDALEKLGGEVPDGLKKVRGRVLVGGGTFLEGMKISRIAAVCSLVDPERDVIDNMPAEFYTGEGGDLSGIAEGLSMVLHLFRRSKKKMSYGFVTIYTDGNGSYWYKSSRSFETAIQESLSSLEVLSDEIKDVTLLKKISSIYRKLSEFLETR